MNGQDVSNSSHEDAVRCFQLAQEPIIVEVLRRHPSQVVASKDEDISNHDKKDKATIMTDSANDNQTLHDVKNETTISLVSTSVQTDWAGLIEDEDLLPVSVCAEEQSNGSFEDFLTHDIDFEVRKTRIFNTECVVTIESSLINNCFFFNTRKLRYGKVKTLKNLD